MTNSTPLASLLDALRSGTVIGDGAMATALHRRGAPVRTCYESLNVTHPKMVEDIHRAYLDAGATVLQTNTFGAHRSGLLRHGLADDIEVINQSGVEVAKLARARFSANRPIFVLGTIGSVQGVIAPGIAYDSARDDEAASEFREQASILLAAGVDGILLETFADLGEILVAISAVRELTNLPILANLSPEVVGVTRDGILLTEAFDRMFEAGADVAGLNCRLGPNGILRSYEGTTLHPERLYAAVPNSGTLHVVEGDFEYTGSPEYFADIAEKLKACGVQYIGGCCGTTPEHIAKVAERLGQSTATELPIRSGAAASDARAQVRMGDARISEGRVFPAPASENRRRNTETLGSETPSVVEMVQTRRTIIVELDPPRTLDVSRFVQGAMALSHAGVDFVTLADNSLGMVRVSNMALASILKQEGMEPLVHVTCRDRNLIGQQSHLMGLHILGIRNILLVTGDPSKFGDLPGATSVYDVSSTELTRMVKRLNEGVAFSGQAMKHASSFVVGTSFNPNVLHFDKAVERLRRKVEAGADFVMTQPMFDIRMFERIYNATKNLGVPIFAGIMPLTSERNAVFMHNEVPGVKIPDEIITRMREAGTEGAVEAGLSIACELVDEATEYFQGLYLITPFLRYELTARLASHVREKDKTGSEKRVIRP